MRAQRPSSAPALVLSAIGAVAALSAFACDDDGLLPDPGNGIRLDVGFVYPDAAPRDAGARDAAPSPDAAAEDAAAPDAEPADAGGEPPCVCPTVPSSCAPPALDSPTFTPGTPAMLEQLFAVMACSDTVLEIAIYEADWDCIVAALAGRLAADSDLEIHLVFDDQQCPRAGGVLSCALSALEGHPRVTLIDDARTRYMHHKLVIADGRQVWVGSANFTRRSFCTDSNDSIVIGDPAMVAAYQAQFRRLFTDRQFGPQPPAPPSTGAPYSVYFGPVSPIDQPPAWFNEIIDAVNTASTSVDFLINAWTRPELAGALIGAQQRGVVVRGVVSTTYVSEAAPQAALAAGVPLKVGAVHNKLLVIDGRRVITGSPNWSQNSWENNENSLWIETATIAAAYLAGFERVYQSASSP
ncbi:MAG: phosphatidylserine/phosphatidylglycerophosphate/cardiolipin synthase family protein [Deltaproteobacteria bacterium]|nr:phosphatidylserine/phosphatidylglycerophosphate/cardiolipin synthase family protein [Deltaproteobacteria bacterium]